MAENLFVCDVDYDVLSCKIQYYWDIQDEVLKKTIDILNSTYEVSVPSGALHESIGILNDAVKLIYNNSSGIGKKVNDIVLSFLNRIDDIDLELYGG